MDDFNSAFESINADQLSGRKINKSALKSCANKLKSAVADNPRFDSSNTSSIASTADNIVKTTKSTDTLPSSANVSIGFSVHPLSKSPSSVSSVPSAIPSSANLNYEISRASSKAKSDWSYDLAPLSKAVLKRGGDSLESNVKQLLSSQGSVALSNLQNAFSSAAFNSMGGADYDLNQLNNMTSKVRKVVDRDYDKYDVEGYGKVSGIAKLQSEMSATYQQEVKSNE